jgi:hypothetical protein
MLNTEIRNEMKKRNICQYEIANKLQLAPGTFAHWLQSELTPERKERVLAAIESIEE